MNITLNFKYNFFFLKFHKKRAQVRVVGHIPSKELRDRLASATQIGLLGDDEEVFGPTGLSYGSHCLNQGDSGPRVSCDVGFPRQFVVD